MERAKKPVIVCKSAKEIADRTMKIIKGQTQGPKRLVHIVQKANASVQTYFEVHFLKREGGDVQFASTYRGKKMRQRSTAEKCMKGLQKKYPNARSWEIAEYDERGRID